jgi:SAM-dependent methyltransferase
LNPAGEVTDRASLRTLHDRNYLMAKLHNRSVLFLSQLFFTGGLIPLLLLPKLASARLVRQAIVHGFGRLLAPRYHQIIEMYGSSYGEALARGLEEAGKLAEGEIKSILDCGTGTGFAARQAASAFPHATVTGVDFVPQMLEQARQNPEGKALGINYVRADILHLPWGDGTMDVVMAQNTAPYLDEFARVCRPGGVVLFIDSAARWTAPFARYAATKTGRFDVIVAEPAGLGFFLAARRAP